MYEMNLTSKFNVTMRLCTLRYFYTGCDNRRFAYESLIKHEIGNFTAVGLALQVAVVCSGAI